VTLAGSEGHALNREARSRAHAAAESATEFTDYPEHAHGREAALTQALLAAISIRVATAVARASASASVVDARSK
jgi:hypothetical protein